MAQKEPWLRTHSLAATSIALAAAALAVASANALCDAPQKAGAQHWLVAHGATVLITLWDALPWVLPLLSACLALWAGWRSRKADDHACAADARLQLEKDEAAEREKASEREHGKALAAAQAQIAAAGARAKGSPYNRRNGSRATAIRRGLDLARNRRFAETDRRS